MLGPTSYGMWKTLGIFQSYTQFADLGALAALKREVPFYTRRNDHEKLAEVRDVAFFVNHVAIFTAAAVLLVSSAFVAEPEYARAMRVFVLLLYAGHIHTFMEQFLYWRKEFAYASKVNLALSIAESILAIFGAYLAGLDGLIVGTFVGYGLAALVQLRRISFDIGFRFRWAAYLDLVRIGFPSHLNGLLYNLLQSVDRLLILPTLGLQALGIYGLGMTINESLFQFSYALGNALSPRLVERWSETESLEKLRPMVEKPTMAIAAATPILLGAVYFGSSAVIAMVLHDYEDALLPLRILLLGTYFSSLHRGLSSLFLALRKQGRLLPVYTGGIVLNAALASAALSLGWGISGVAAATSASLTVLSLTLVSMAMSFFIKGTVARVLSTIRFVAPLIWALLCAVAGEIASRLAGGAMRPLVSSIAGLLVFTALYSPALLIVYRRLSRPASAA